MNDNEKKLSDFIDSLNDEKRPNTKTDSEELDSLYDVVRQVKSLKEPIMPDKDFSHRISQSLKVEKKSSSKNRKRLWIGSLASIAAVLVIAIMMNFITPTNNTNIVYAMEQAYNDIEAYHGTLEIISNNEDGEEQVQSELEVWIDKNNNFHIEVIEGSYKGLVIVRNGDKVLSVPVKENQENIFPVFTETYEFIFELGSEIDEVKNAESTKIVGDDNIAGRPSYIMEVTPKGGLTYKLWVDKETKLPLQKEGAMNKAIQYTTRYTEIDFINTIPEDLIAFDPSKGYMEVNLGNDKQDDIVDNGDVTKHNPEIEVDIDMEIEKAEQISADSGSSPWKLDPAFVAQIFVSLQLSPEGIVGDYPIAYEELVIIENDGVKAIIEINSDKTDIERVYLERLIRQDNTGVWTVIGYDL